MEIELYKVYHFVAKNEMKKKVQDYSKQLKLSFSKTMRLIIDTMLPLVDNYMIFEVESSDFGYDEFGAEVDIKFSIDPNVYRKLKNTHGVMHTFSIAVMIRKMIDLFFYFIERKSLEWLKNLMSCCKNKIVRILTKMRRFMKNTEKMEHMYGEELMEEQISMIFSKNYTLLGVDLSKNKLVYKDDI